MRMQAEIANKNEELETLKVGKVVLASIIMQTC